MGSQRTAHGAIRLPFICTFSNGVRLIDQSKMVQIVLQRFLQSIWQGLGILVDRMDKHTVHKDDFVLFLHSFYCGKIPITHNMKFVIVMILKSTIQGLGM